ncbi:MAG: CHAT domain-containing protein [Deltaproteobacteria bacterium]|nr:CHAT domain-containing protein [Deltaproteobacteria bacterium]
MAVRKTGRKGSGEGRGNGGMTGGASQDTREMRTEDKRTGHALRDDLVEEALITGEHRDLLETYFGEEAYEDLRFLATRAQTARTRGGPRVLILPGIMGSKLGRPRFLFDDTIWIDPVDIVVGRLRELSLVDGRKDVQPVGVILLAYLKLKLRLKQAGFDADFHPFDWRKGIPETGAELAARIRKETGRDSGREDLTLVSHSMGGLVSRAALKHLKDTGEASRVRRLIMLGTPNFGSFSPVQALSGTHSMVRKVAAVDLANSREELVNLIFNTFPGLYQMLPARDKFSGVDLYSAANWPATGMGPRDALLADAPGMHHSLAPPDDRLALIAGVNQETVVSVRKEGEAFVYATSNEGDGTVPLAFAQLEGVTTYFVEEEHGSLPNNGDVARAVIDLVERGRTDVLPDAWTRGRRGALRELRPDDLPQVPFGGRRGAEVSPREVREILSEFAAPPARARETVPPAPAVEFAKVTGEPIVVGRKRQRRLDLQMAHGSVTQADTRAVVLGLFRGVAPSGAARAIDEQLGGVVTDFVERRMIGGNVGEVFIMPANRYRMGADMVVFCGLGSYDDFNEEVLRIVAENTARALARTRVDEFATVLLSTGSGMPVGVVLANLLQGFLRGLQEGDRENRLRSITLCELDSERFAQMHAELLRLTTTALFDDLEVTVEMRELPPMPAPVAVFPGRAPRLPEDPVYLMVRDMEDTRDQETNPAIDADFALRASVLTAGSRATVITDVVDVKGRELNAHLEQIEKESFDFTGLDAFGRKLADLVLPQLVRKVLSNMQERHLVVIHDARASRIPWETLCIDRWQPAASAGLSRKYEAEDLSVAGWLEERRLADRLRVLLIVNPTGDLPGAEKEGDRIKGLLSGDPAFLVDELRGVEATWSAVRARFRSGDYDVIHYAGHAFFDPVRRSRSGILCHGRQVLSGRDLVHLEKLPALVFFNACEAGRVRGADAIGGEAAGEPTAQRLERNVGLAEAFLRAGVGNYVGTYWPVGDTAAEQFAQVFYKGLVNGSSVGDALQEGRRRVLQLKSVDWADYVHYGSPGFVVKVRR